ncbi:phosphatidate cytidylyltransferase [Kineococcus sp. R8]|uniref:phosphatidate cytidylyltransferase n=1 Tax=Kineococcus siccus TaxID=2696567 RepID=UPI00141205FD|nr:phosphatidate cytidylyltransferase [Kineococcus siccus]
MNASAAGGPTAAAPARKAGRNLPQAVGVGFGLGGVLVLSLFIRREAFVVVVVAAVVYGSVEMARAFRSRHLQVPVLPVAAGAVAMVPGAYVGGAATLAVAYALTVFAVLAWRFVSPPAASGAPVPTPSVRDVAGGVFVATYVPLLASFTMLMLREPEGAWRVLLFVVLVVASDIGGFAAGVFFGRHPMAPSVSPKKSWEGLAGSFAAGAVLGAVCLPLMLGGSWWGGALLGLAAVAIATLGDLSESMLKRDLGIKDMGDVLPGHGGVMDRLDSLLPAAPVVHLLLIVLVGS